jgi:hypothetical protein
MQNQQGGRGSVEARLGQAYAKVVEKTQHLQNTHVLDKSDLILANLMQEAVLRISVLTMNHNLIAQGEQGFIS